MVIPLGLISHTPPSMGHMWVEKMLRSTGVTEPGLDRKSRTWILSSVLLWSIWPTHLTSYPFWVSVSWFVRWGESYLLPSISTQWKCRSCPHLPHGKRTGEIKELLSSFPVQTIKITVYQMRISFSYDIPVKQIFQEIRDKRCLQQHMTCSRSKI